MSVINTQKERALWKQIRAVVVAERRKLDPNYCATGAAFSSELSSEHALDRHMRLNERDSYLQNFVHELGDELPAFATRCDVSAMYVAARLLGADAWPAVFERAKGSRVSPELRQRVADYLQRYAKPSEAEWHEVGTLFSRYFRARVDVSGTVPRSAAKFVSANLRRLGAFTDNDKDSLKRGVFVYATAASPDAAVRTNVASLVRGLLHSGYATDEKALAELQEQAARVGADIDTRKLVAFMITAMCLPNAGG